MKNPNECRHILIYNIVYLEVLREPPDRFSPLFRTIFLFLSFENKISDSLSEKRKKTPEYQVSQRFNGSYYCSF